MPTLPLFSEEAAKGLRIFRRLRVPDMIGTPKLADVCSPWFLKIVEVLFGCYDRETHRRMIQEYFLLVPKKNSKSSYGGPLMLTAAIMNARPEAEFNYVGPTKKIAGIAYNQAAGTIKLDPELDKLFQCRDHIKTIEHRKNGTKLQILAADTNIVTGGKQVATMIDETHVFAQKAKADDIFLELRGAMTSKPDGFLFQTTTQSKLPPTGVFKQELQTAREVRDGVLDERVLAILYEYPKAYFEKDAWKDPSTWPIVNPNYNKSVNEDYLKAQMRKAERKGKDAVILFASQHMNIEIGLRLGNDRWRGADYWLAAADPSLTLETLIERSEVCTIGIDGGGNDDLVGLAVLGRCTETNRWMLWNHAWCKPQVLDLRKEIAPKLQELAGLGQLTICEHPTDDVIGVADIVEQVYDAGLLPEKYGVGFDPIGISAMVDELSDRGIENAENGGPVGGVAQGYRLTGAIWGMERKLTDGTLIHASQELMTFCVGNAKAERRGNALIIDKQISGTAKIDPLVASFNAFKYMERKPEAAGPSAYRERGLLMVG